MKIDILKDMAHMSVSQLRHLQLCSNNEQICTLCSRLLIMISETLPSSG